MHTTRRLAGTAVGILAFAAVVVPGSPGFTATGAATSADEAPQTKITKKPPKVVKTSKKKASVEFRFTSSASYKYFTCTMDKKTAACAPAQIWKVKPGTHHFSVAAIDDNRMQDPTPATYSFRVKRTR